MKSLSSVGLVYCLKICVCVCSTSGSGGGMKEIKVTVYG
jgi:hypothetical protein